MSIKFDANGNIDPSSLEKDLQQALDADVKYKQTDNMKKRAIKVAGSYDEFKNMVACAHLKKVSSQDLESLKEVKKGWKKQSVSQASLSLLPSDAGAATPTVAALVPEPERRKAPKTFTAFHKVWRRLEGPDSKFSYLNEVGCTRTQNLLTAECDVEVLEDIVTVLLQQSCISDAVSDSKGGDEGEGDVDLANIVVWFKALVALRGFDFNARFFSADLKERAILFLEGCGDEAAVELSHKFRAA